MKGKPTWCGEQKTIQGQVKQQEQNQMTNI